MSILPFTKVPVRAAFVRSAGPGIWRAKFWNERGAILFETGGGSFADAAWAARNHPYHSGLPVIDGDFYNPRGPGERAA